MQGGSNVKSIDSQHWRVLSLHTAPGFDANYLPAPCQLWAVTGFASYINVENSGDFKIGDPTGAFVFGFDSGNFYTDAPVMFPAWHCCHAWAPFV